MGWIREEIPAPEREQLRIPAPAPDPGIRSGSRKPFSFESTEFSSHFVYLNITRTSPRFITR